MKSLRADGLLSLFSATAPLATPSNSVIFHDAWCTESWYLQGFVKT